MKNKKKKILTIVGTTVTFNACNKLFKPLDLPSGPVKSRKGFQVKYPQKLFQKENLFGFFSELLCTKLEKDMYTF